MMRAYEFYVLETFFKMRDEFPESCHQAVYSHLLHVLCAINWPLLSDAERDPFYRHENSSSVATVSGQILLPSLVHGALHLAVIKGGPEILQDRRDRCLRVAPSEDAAAPVQGDYADPLKSGSAAAAAEHDFNVTAGVTEIDPLNL